MKSLAYIVGYIRRETVNKRNRMSGRNTTVKKRRAVEEKGNDGVCVILDREVKEGVALTAIGAGPTFRRHSGHWCQAHIPRRHSGMIQFNSILLEAHVTLPVA